MTAAPPGGGRGDRWRALALAAAALSMFLLLGQNLMHGFDAYYYLRSVEAGEFRHPRMVFYLPVAIAWSRALATFGVDTYEALRALSGVGAAVGVYCAYFVALRLGQGRQRAVLCAAGCAAVPAVLYSASVVEVDTILFGCACIAWLPFARLLTDGRAVWAIVTGVATALAAGFHAAGHLLAATLCGLLLGWGWPARRFAFSVPRAALLSGTHLLLSIGVAALAGVSEQQVMATNTIGHPFHPDFIGHVLWHEWLLPYLPFALLSLLVFRERTQRGCALAYVACLLGYLYVTTLILGYQRYASDYLTQGNIVERGTFLFGITLPMVLLSVRSVAPRIAWTAIAAAVASGIVQIRVHDWPPDPPAYAAGFAEAIEGGPMTMLVADTREWAWIARRHPEVQCTIIARLELEAQQARQRFAITIEPDHFLTWFDLEYDRAIAHGCAYVITDRALQGLRASGDATLAATVPLLQQGYEFEPLRAQGFTGYRLHRR